MSLTGSNIQTYVGRLTGDTSTAGQQVVLDILQGVLQEVYDKGLWSWRWRVWELTVPGPYTTGTVAVAAGGTAVTGSGTDFTTITGYDDADDNFLIRLGQDLYRLDELTDATNAVLKAGSESAHTASDTEIYRLFHDLDAECQLLAGMRCYPYGALKKWSIERMEEQFHIMNTSVVPVAYAQGPPNSDKTLRVAIYPLQTERKHYRYGGWAKAPDISGGSTDCGCPDSFARCLIDGILAEWYVAYDDRPDRASIHAQRFEMRLEKLWSGRDRNDGRRQMKGWTDGPSRRDTLFHVPQEFWNTT